MKLGFLSPEHPLWLAGFRPFFVAAITMGAILPSIWGLIFSGQLSIPISLNPLQWHAHEMLFGFGGAVLFGFLLTASKNWVHVRGIHGAGLMLLFGLWVIERIIFNFIYISNPVLKHLTLSLFVVCCGAYIIATLIRNRKNDTFKDNYYFLILIGLIVVAKNLLISELYYAHGIALSLGLFRLAFAVMFERTITQFMKNTEGLTLLRNFWLDTAIKILVLLSVLQSFLPSSIAAPLLFSAAQLLLIRWTLWQPQVGLRKFGNAVMYVGYMGLILHFLFEALKLAGLWSYPTLSIHIFTFLCMGVIIPAMLIRIAQGHTGRKPEFIKTDKVVISLMLLAAAFRLILPLLYPAQYTHWILCAGLMWLVAFSLLGVRLIPFLIRPRIDGKIH